MLFIFVFTSCSGLEVAFIDICDTLFGLQMMYISFSISPIILYSQLFVLLLIDTFFPRSRKYRFSNRRIFTAVFSCLSPVPVVQLSTEEISKISQNSHHWMRRGWKNAEIKESSRKNGQKQKSFSFALLAKVFYSLPHICFFFKPLFLSTSRWKFVLRNLVFFGRETLDNMAYV